MFNPTVRASYAVLILAICAGRSVAGDDDSKAKSDTCARSKTIARCGKGFLETIDGYKVLHVKGTPYEMGYQQGVLLKDDMRELTHFLFEVKGKEMQIELGKLKLGPKPILSLIAARERIHMPERYFEEMRGLASGSGLPLNDVVTANFIPEMFHCSGFAIAGSATKDGTLYHGRVLDYGVDWRLQEFAVLVVAEPEGKHPFVNITYAGFIGSVSGMNAEHVSIGEMGGEGAGHYGGVPMSFLVRWALEEADSLDSAVAIFRDHPRTCEYYYVIADGETGKAVGMEASWNKFYTVPMGESHPRLPIAIKDAVALSAGDRYKELTRRIQAGLGSFDAESARHLMDRPVAMKSNLHDVLFEPAGTRLWVSNASKSAEPAANQPYHAFRLTDLLHHQPDADAPEKAK